MALRCKHALIALVGILFLASAIGVPTLVHQCCGVVSTSIATPEQATECDGCCTDLAEDESSDDQDDCCSDKMVLTHAEVDEAPTPASSVITQPDIVYLPFELTMELEMCSAERVTRRPDDGVADPPSCDDQAKLGVFLI